MGGYDLGEMFMIFGFSLWYCPSLLAFPVWLWAWRRKPTMRRPKAFVIGMGIHVLNVLIVVWRLWWIKYVAVDDCHGCVGAFHLIFMLPIIWLLFVCGATCNVVGLRQPSVADGKKKRLKRRNS